MSLNNRYNKNKPKSFGSREGLGRKLHAIKGTPLVRQNKKMTAKGSK